MKGENVMAHKVGDRILYGAVGIMEITDIREESIGAFSKQYYVLREVNAISDAQTYVPCDNERLVSLMHPLLTRKEIRALIECKDIPDIEWEQNNRLRSEKYHKIMESGDRYGMLSMIKSIEKMGKARASEGKKNYIADDTAMRKAIKLLNLEISLVMDIPLESVPEFLEGVKK